VMLLAPAFLLLALIVVYPIGKLVWNSFFDLRLSGGGSVKFIGWENYVLVLQDRDFWNATRNTVLITLITVPGALVVGLGLALLANLPFKRQWPVRLALLLVPAELPGLLRLALVTADGCLAWATRRVPPPRPEGLRLGDRRKGVYDGFFAMNVISFVVEIPLMALLMSSVAKPWPHVVLHTLEAALVVFVLGDRWWVHAGGHVLTATHLDLCAGARALARVPLAAIASIEPLGKGVTRQAWCRAHGVHPADTGTVSVMDGPNLVLTLQGGVAGTWSRLQVQRPLPRHLFVYLDDPAALAPAVAAAQAAASGS